MRSKHDLVALRLSIVLMSLVLSLAGCAETSHPVSVPNGSPNEADLSDASADKVPVEVGAVVADGKVTRSEMEQLDQLYFQCLWDSGLTGTVSLNLDLSPTYLMQDLTLRDKAAAAGVKAGDIVLRAIDNCALYTTQAASMYPVGNDPATRANWRRGWKTCISARIPRIADQVGESPTGESLVDLSEKVQMSSQESDEFEDCVLTAGSPVRKLADVVGQAGP